MMEFADLLEKFSDYGQGGHQLLETFVVELLKIEASSHNQPLLVDEANRGGFDAIAPNGLGDMNQPLAIEILFSLNPQNSDRLARRVHQLAENKNSGAVLIITMRTYDSRSRKFQDFFEDLRFPIYLWDQQNIQSLINKHVVAVAALNDRLFSTRIEAAIKDSTADWKSQRGDILNEVAAYYRAGRFSIWLGAGVSSSAGLPDWNTLLNSLFVAMLTDNDEGDVKASTDSISTIVARLRVVDGPSTLTLARYIRKGLAAGSAQESDKFIEAVTRQLYGLRNENYPLTSPLISRLAALCTPSRTGARVRAVLTYNFDDLVERVLAERGVRFRSIFEEIDMAAAEELPIYHVHGFLPHDRSQYAGLSKSTLVFSEEGYHHIYRDAYHWSNLIQLNNLKETTCLMVGLSLTDPNLRRLLEISAKTLDKPRHFAFLKRITFEEFTNDDSTRSLNQAALQKFLTRHHSLNESLMSELGVKVIWYEDYAEIPTMLEQIAEYL